MVSPPRKHASTDLIVSQTSTSATSRKSAEAIELGFKGSFLENRLYLGVALFSQKIDGLQRSDRLGGECSLYSDIPMYSLPAPGEEIEFKVSSELQGD